MSCFAGALPLSPPYNPTCPSTLLAGALSLACRYLTMLYGAKWYAAITVAWGVVAACCAFVTSRAGFFATRLLLGVAEAGAWPSASHLLCQFYPSDRWARGAGAATAHTSLIKSVWLLLPLLVTWLRWAPGGPPATCWGQQQANTRPTGKKWCFECSKRCSDPSEGGWPFASHLLCHFI